MARRALHNCAETHNGVHLLLRGNCLRHERQFICTRNAHQEYVSRLPAMAHECIFRAFHKLFGQKAIKAADDNRHLKSFRKELTVYFFHGRCNLLKSLL